ncbi:MAG TPA: cation diffusion facilitator family transporter [Frankiaceae bacterium]|jgi:cation diffusion facilitator family transporter|nr:cation diffusion facilitator family transporter [Frankiaceae bacterium]
MSSGGHGRKAVVAALLANLGIAAAKLVAFVLTRSASMLAESVHSLADSGNQGLLLLGAAQAKKEATPEHPFGYGSARYFWSFVVAVVLFTVGGAFALYEGYEKLRHPHEVESYTVALVVLLVAIVLESFSMRTAVAETKPQLRGRSYWRFVKESKTAELPVVLLEDAAALLGLVIALAGVELTAATHEPRWDALGTMTIGALLVGVAIILAIEMHSLLIGEAASPSEIAAIEQALVASPDFERVIHLRTMHLGPDELLVAAKVATPCGGTTERLAEQIDNAEARVRAAVPSAHLVYIEPDLYRPV